MYNDEIAEMIENPLTDELLKNMINFMENNPDESLYKHFKEANNKKPFKFETTIKSFFQKYINRLLGIDRKSIENYGNKHLLNDYDLIKKNREALSNMSLSDLFNSDIFSKLRYKTVYPQKEGSQYIHVRDLENVENLECRIYMCPDPDKCMKICDLIVEKHKEYGVPYYFKINTNSKENDRIIMYCSYDYFKLHCKIIKEIQAENPDLFEGSEKNQLWSNIKGYQNIYFGGEPYYTGYESYTSRFCRVINKAYNDFKQIHNNEFDINKSYNEFKEYLNKEFIIENINPLNPAFNYSNNKAKSNDEGITQINYNSKEYQIYVAPLISEDECRITIDPLVFYSITIPKEDFYLLYERQPKDKDYEQSKNYRRNVIEKLLEAKKDYENKPKTVLHQTEFSGKIR